LDAVILRPYYPVSGLFRLSRDLDGMQIDFMTKIDGVKSLESLRARAHAVELGGHKLWVADLAAIIDSKRAAGRPQDKAVLGTLKKALDEKNAETKARQLKTAARRTEKGE
jgi:predicted nucleotidyltransferase